MRRRVSSPNFAGRARELGDLVDALGRADVGRPTVALIGGEAGIGKTRLVGEFIAIARRRGATVATGGCVELGDLNLPFAPIVEVIRSLVATHDPGALAAVLGPARDEAEKLVPDLATALASVERRPDAVRTTGPWPLPDDIDPAIRSVRLELLLGVVRRMGTASPFVVVLEDLHWADPSTLDLVAYVTRNLTTERLILVGTYRTDAMPPGHPLRHLAVELARDPRVERYDLAPLGRDDLRVLIEGVLGRVPDPAFEERIAARSDGNPFFAEELIDAEVEAAGRSIPTELRELLLDRVGRLPEPAVAIARVVAVAGRGADDATLAEVSGLGPGDVAAAIRTCVDEQLLVPADDGSYSFRHGLVGEAIADDLLPGELRRLHAAFATARSATPLPVGPGRAVEAAERARHWAAAGRPAEAFGASLIAAAAAGEIGGFAEAGSQLDRVLDLWGSVSDPMAVADADRAEISDRAAEAWALAGETERAIEREAAAVEGVDPAVDPVRAGVLRARLASHHLELEHETDALALFDSALDLLAGDGATRERARALVGRAATLMRMGRHRESAEACRTALAIESKDTFRAEGPAHDYLGVDLVALGQVEEGLAELREARRIAAGGGPPETLIEANRDYARMLDRADRLDEAAAEALAGAAQAEAAGLGRRSGLGLRAVAAIALVRCGRWAEAQAILDECATMAPRGISAVLVHRAQATLDVERGRLIQAATHAEAAQAFAGDGGRADTRPAIVAVDAELAISERRWEDAAGLVVREVDRLAALEDGYWIAPLVALGVRSEAERTATIRATRATIGLAESRATAEDLLTAGRAAISAATAPARSSLANAALAEAEWTRFDGHPAADAWAAAAEAFDAIPEPLRAAYARYRQAEALLAAKAPRDEVTAVLRAAARTADELGAEPLRTSVVELARRGRLDIAVEAGSAGARLPAEARPADALGLTPRELEILAIVARGRTNHQIAEELFITEKTVGVHMTNILGKLGVTNRIDAAAIADRLGIGRERIVADDAVLLDRRDEAAGPAGPSRHPRMRRAFMFTDIVRSTALIGVIGDDAWVDLRRWHDVRLRAIFAAHRGEELDHAGDGFLVAFERSADALACAVEIQRALAEHRRLEGFAPSVRIGVHLSEAVRTDAGFSGRALHEGARIAALAGADEIVASVDTIRDAPARGPMPQSRSVSLKGIAEPMAVVTVPWRTD